MLSYPSQQCPAVTTAFSEMRDPVHTIVVPIAPSLVIKTSWGNSPEKKDFFSRANFSIWPWSFIDRWVRLISQCGLGPFSHRMQLSMLDTVMTGNTIFNERILICVVLLCYPSQQCPAVTTAFSETRDPVHIRDPSHPRVIETRCGNSPGKVLLQKYFETTNFEKILWRNFQKYFEKYSTRFSICSPIDSAPWQRRRKILASLRSNHNKSEKKTLASDHPGMCPTLSNLAMSLLWLSADKKMTVALCFIQWKGVKP